MSIEVTIILDGERQEQLQHVAQQLGITVEKVVAQTIDDYLSRRRQFESAADYVLQKNAELYRRLA